MRIFLTVCILGLLGCNQVSDVNKSFIVNSESVEDTTLKMLTYGLPDVEWLDAAIIVSKNYGFTYYSVAGCIVSQKLIDSIGIENKKTRTILEIRNGMDWQTKFDREVKDMRILLTRANNVLKKSKYFKIINKYFDANELGLCYSTFPTSKSNQIFEVEIYTLEDSIGYTRSERYYLLSVDLKKEMVTIKDSARVIKIFSNRK